METVLKDLVGRKIQKIFVNEDVVKFVTDGGTFVYEVYGDCCSRSYLYDFYGVEKLLKNGPVTNVQEVELTKEDKSYIPYDPSDRKESEYGDYIQCYGFQIFVEDPKWGEVTACFSFRNSSNGYYGGWISKVEDREAYKLVEITEDALDISKL